jgi:hypothetical protein
MHGCGTFPTCKRQRVPCAPNARVVKWQTRQLEGLVGGIARASSSLAPSTIFRGLTPLCISATVHRSMILGDVLRAVLMDEPASPVNT